MEAMDKEVRKVMLVDMVTMMKVPSNPTFPTTHPKRRYMITPNMVRMEGVNTPSNVLNPWDFPGDPSVVACFKFKKFFTR
jgi:hypothetical protein